MELAEQIPQGILTPAQASIDEFLCRALRGEPAPWTEAPGATQDEFLERCRHHGIAGLVFHSVKSQPFWESWPPSVQVALQRDGMAGVAQDLIRRQYLERLLKALGQQSIRCLLIKGEALAKGVYRVPGTRTRSDIDLFIEPRNILRVRDLVLEMGYRVYPPLFKSHQFTVMREHDEGVGIRFDIHWRILNEPRFARSIGFEEAFGDSVGIPGLEPGRMLCYEDALLLACMHRFGSLRHDPNRLIWISDIHALLSCMDREALGRFVDKALVKGVAEECLDGVIRARKCFGTQISDNLLARLQGFGNRNPRSGRTQNSQLALLMSDWLELPDWQARRGLLGELFLPSGKDLLLKFGKKSRLWLPLLYVRQVVGGAIARLTFR